MKRIVGWLSLAVLFAATIAPARADTVLITGATQGHGLAFAEDYAKRGWTVIATARDPAKAEALQKLAAAHKTITIEALDITNYAQVDALAAKYKTTPIDVLNLNGAINSFRVGPEAFGPLAPERLNEILETNVTAQVHMAEAFLDSVAASKQKKIAAMSAVGGSIGNVRNATAPAYRASKAALNMIMRAYGEQVKAKGVAVLVIAPGTVDVYNYMALSDLSQVPERYRRQIEMKVLAPRSAIGSMIDLIDKLTVADIGAFHQWDGKHLPW
ncbi:MAG: SDR family NAD(P)-dependent oxidoreductase [Rhodospirillaceae bacterium]|nr:SDR family NAD(P)-dependent oxidoreductase [Rhodospirillaceae bacterium]